MRNFIILAVFIFSAFASVSQNPILLDCYNYSATVSTVDPDAIAINSFVRIEVSISIEESVVFFETHSTYTDSQGTVMIEIGEGSSIQNLDAISTQSDVSPKIKFRVLDTANKDFELSRIHQNCEKAHRRGSDHPHGK